MLVEPWLRRGRQRATDTGGLGNAERAKGILFVQETSVPRAKRREAGGARRDESRAIRCTWSERPMSNGVFRYETTDLLTLCENTNNTRTAESASTCHRQIVESLLRLYQYA